ncbi:hypothetical protein FISHEDRAFT_64619 [Fistulina hepatica ATCC 64428]|nr:hypothetical protein FISHEDRAFT_64619 [Fistulina hepatica ATCC 64428]
MQPQSDATGTSITRSGIPVPATLKKPTASIRQSMAGQPIRAAPLQPPGSALRQSILRPPGNPLLQSASKHTPYGQTPLKTVRRGSLWQGAIGTAPPVPRTLRDARPIKDRSYQSKMRQEVLGYLQSVGLEYEMSTLLNISGNHFRNIFQTLVLIVEPMFTFNKNQKMNDDVVLALEMLHYPFVNSINKKWMDAPGSMHAWPHLLAALHWLVMECQLKDECLTSGHPAMQLYERVPDDFDHELDHRALAGHYYGEAYTAWLQEPPEGAQDNSRYFDNGWLEEKYAIRNEHIENDSIEKAKIQDGLALEMDKLQNSAAPLSQLEDALRTLQRDHEKFKEILDRNRKKNEKVKDHIIHATLMQMRVEQQRLLDIVHAQNLTPEEVHRMNQDHDVLTQNLKDLRQKIAETHKLVMSLEVNVANRAEAADETVDSHNNLLASLELVPPLPDPWQDLDPTLELNTATPNPSELLRGEDIRKRIRPMLSGIADAKRAEYASVQNERISDDHQLEKVNVECENYDEEIAELDKQVTAFSQQTEERRVAAQHDAKIAADEVARLENELHNARMSATASGLGAKTQLQTLQFSYQEQINKVAALKEETTHNILKSGHDILLFKEEVSRHLREFQEFAERE